MAKRQGNRLSALSIAKLAKKPGLHNDGHGLVLETRGGRCCWRFRYTFMGTPKWMGLGPVHSVSLQEARARAADARKLILDGHDPLTVKRDHVAAVLVHNARTLTFEQAARRFMATDTIQKLKDSASWPRTLGYVFPAIGSLPLQQIDSAVVLHALLPVVKDNGAETASRLRGRIERVFAWATAHQFFTGPNPASREVLRDALPAKPKVKHHRAMPYADLPDFIHRLRERDSVSALALEFCILTASRTSEVIGARWSEFDLAAKTWTIPGERMKAGKAHVVPLSDRAVEILLAQMETQSVSKGDAFVFINGGGKAISNMAMLQLMKGMDADGVPHGMRSTFMDWAHEQTTYAKHVIDMALAHTIGDKVEAAYRRGDLLERRTKLMAQWAAYCDSHGAARGEVIPIRA